jgi:excisionase family DNA binding protein
MRPQHQQVGAGEVRPTSPALRDHRHARSEAVTDFAPVLSQILTALEEIRARLAGAHKPWYTVEEVAQLTGRSDYTIRRWIKEKRIEAIRVQDTGPRGRLLVAHDQLRRLTAVGLGSGIPDTHAD